MFNTRSSGLLLHVTSLPGPFGIGDLGPAAYQFVDLLHEAGQQVWQVLPLVPPGWGYSPYSSPSTFAGNPLLVSPDALVADGLLTAEDLSDLPDFPADRVDWEAVVPFKRALLEKAWARFQDDADHPLHADLWTFASQQRHWLDDYALYMALSEASGTSWTEWPEALARRHPHALHQARQEYAEAFQMHQFWQMLFDRQWQALRAYGAGRGVHILGDLPIYVAHDSADVWAHQHLFFLDETGQPTVVSGVPPDYFSETGQRWGNPLYRWDDMRQDGFAWWTARMANVLRLVDAVRLDHFRGFAGYWEIPAAEETAIGGRWVPGPGADLFHTLRARLGPLPVVAENLGEITPDVTALMEQFGFPGMAVLQFAFGGGPDSAFLPHNYTPQLVAYTGTHDNDTTVGWWNDAGSPEHAAAFARERAHAARYLFPCEHAPIHQAFIRAISASVAALVIIPFQDVLGLGSEARMNVPGSDADNWAWRCTPAHLEAANTAFLREVTALYGRALKGAERA